MLVGDIIRYNAVNYPSKVGLVSGGRRLTWLEVNRHVNCLANALLGLGLAPGDRLGIACGNGYTGVEAYFAALKAGLVVVPINIRLAGPEIIAILNTAGAKGLLVESPFAPAMSAIRDRLESVRIVVGIGPDHGFEQDFDTLLQRASDREPDVYVEEDDLALLFFTSGTTGLPKGVPHTHRNNVAAAFMLSSEFQFTPDAVIHSVAPTFFAGGWYGNVISGCLRGSTLVIENFEPTAALDTMEREKITHSPLVPTMLNMLLQEPSFHRRRFPALRFATLAGSPVHPSLILAALDVYNRSFNINYGMTEACGVGCILRDDQIAFEGERAKRLSSVGTAMVGMAARVVDDHLQPVEPGSDTVGEVLLKGDCVLSRYWNNPEATAEAIEPDGWFHTGDMARMDEDGMIYIVDRSKDMIISGGINIYSREVEEVLFKHPDVLNAAVIGIPDERWGEVVLAVVVPRPGRQPTADQVIEYCRQQLASYKKPSRVEFVAALPTTATGKVLKHELRKPYWEGRERKVH